MTDPNDSTGLARKVHLAELAAVREHLAEQEQAATDRAEALLAPIAAKAREHQARDRAEHRAQVLREAADAVFALDYDDLVSEQDDENFGSMREAWDLGTIHASQLLRRLADEAATETPGKAIREVRGDQCAWCGDPLHDETEEWITLTIRSEEWALCRECGESPDTMARLIRHITHNDEPAAGAEHADTETVHACSPDGSGLTPCCGRTPFELPRGDRISSEAPTTCTGPTAGAGQDGASS